MGRLENALYIIQGEVSLLVTAMRRNSRWMSSNAHQVLITFVLTVTSSISSHSFKLLSDPNLQFFISTSVNR